MSSFNIHELFHACEIGDRKKVETFLDTTKADVDTPDAEDLTALQVAAANDQIEIVKLLLDRDANPARSNRSGWTAIHHASFHGHIHTIDTLLKHSEINRHLLRLRNSFGATPLNVAVAGGHAPTVGLLLESGASVDEYEDDDDDAPRFDHCPGPTVTAALYARENILRALLEVFPDGANISTPASAWTPLMFAAANGNKPVAQLLIDRGADADAINLTGDTAHDVATVCSNPEVRVYLGDKTTVSSRRRRSTIGGPTSQTDLFLNAIREGHLERVAEFVSGGGVAIDATDSVGATGLMLAAIGGHEDVARLLVNRGGANIDLQDRVNGWTALMQATFYDQRSVAKFLLSRGADSTITASNGFTALDLATLVEETDTELLRMLAKKTVDDAPPAIVMPDSKKAFVSRSKSMANLSGLRGSSTMVETKTGFRGWLEKVSSRFRRVKPENMPLSISVTPAEPPTTVNDLQIVSLDTARTLPNGEEEDDADNSNSVFTLGFAAATTDLSSYAVAPMLNTFKRGLVSSSHMGIMPKGAPRYNNPVSEWDAPDSGARKKGKTIFKKTAKPQSRNVRRSSTHTFHNSDSGPGISNRSKPGHKRVPSDPVGFSSASSSKSVRSVLSRIGQSRYADLFEQEEIDAEAFKELDGADLKELGIAEKDARQAILSAIRRL